MMLLVHESRAQELGMRSKQKRKDRISLNITVFDSSWRRSTSPAAAAREMPEVTPRRPVQEGLVPRSSESCSQCHAGSSHVMHQAAQRHTQDTRVLRHLSLICHADYVQPVIR